MNRPVVIPNGTAVAAVRQLFVREDLERYFPLSRDVLQPVTTYAKIPYVGDVHNEQRALGIGNDEEFYVIMRKSQWSMALTITDSGLVLLNVQPKPGLDAASLEFPGGGIGDNPVNDEDEIISRTEEQVLRETGYGGGVASYLGFSLVETGKYATPSAEEPHVAGVGRGFKAHCVLIQNASLIADQKLAPTEKIQPILVTIADLKELVRANVLTETSSLACFALALMNGHLDRK